jgi:N-acetylglucosamine-6-phosphate deacetylase
MKYALTDCCIYSGYDIITDKTIIIENQYIIDVCDINNLPDNLEIHSLNDANITAGFIDIQINGGGGLYFTDSISTETLNKIFEVHQNFGVSLICPALISTEYKNIFRAIDTVRECLDQNALGIYGLHLEGPYLSPEKPGAHESSHLRIPNTSELRLLANYGRGIIKVMTIAPELFTEEQIRILQDCGIILLAGHSSASFQKAVEYFRKGIKGVTHLFNAMTQLQSRNPGVIGAAFDNDDIYASIIVDGLHCDYANVRIAKKIKGNKLFLISDSSLCIGTELKEFKVGNNRIFIHDGKCVSEQGMLAGSTITMLDAIKNCVKEVGISLDEALRMANFYPARFLGIDNCYGLIEPGYFADLTIFADDLQIQKTIIKGKMYS